MASPALVRANGEILLGVQLQTSSDDVSRDLGTALAAALEAPVGRPGRPGPDRRRARPARACRSCSTRRRPSRSPCTTTSGSGSRAPTPDAEADGRPGARQRGDPADGPARRAGRRLLGAARATSAPTCAGCARSRRSSCSTRSPGCGAAEQLLLGEGTRYAGAFRALGLVVPVWDLPADVPAEDWVGPAAEFQTRLEQALADTAELTADERRARAGLISRQITLR